MRILCWTTSYWENQEQAESRIYGAFGLTKWYNRVQYLFRPDDVFVASGTWSDPLICPFHVVNAGVARTEPYEPIWWNYPACAFTAAMAYALNRNDWDLLIGLDTEVLVGAVDFKALLEDFWKRPELLLSENWYGRPGGLFALKREGASRMLHMRHRANLIEDKSTVPVLIEDEIGIIFKGKWWNPWPHIPNMRQGHPQNPEAHLLNEEALTWPFVERPHPEIIERYKKEQSDGARPYR